MTYRTFAVLAIAAACAAGCAHDPNTDEAAAGDAAAPPATDAAAAAPSATNPAQDVTASNPQADGAAAGSSPVTSFATLDRDTDGKISESEMAAHALLAQRFREIDSDADGEVTHREFTAFADRQSGEVAPSQP